ncbi:MAG: prolyl oligopeptidase family serine peptidase, partial [Armatimonadetes bacterium]|nr:prolyl oligopeptidase family serine peptidase [Armatimonadota bacterium]
MLRDYSRRRALGVSVLLIFLLITSVLMFREVSVRLPRYSACQQRLARLEHRVSQETAWKLEDRAEGDDSRPTDSFLIQLEFARFRLTSLRRDKLPRLQKFQWTLGGLEKDYKALQRGRDPYLNRKGILLRAYYSDIDGTLQPFSLAIPRDYTGKKSCPLIVHLHSHGWFRPFQGHPAPKVRGAIVLSPHGRGSTDYMFLGEQDVVHAIAVTKRLYNIDGDRVYLMGRSMGGTGCWHLAVRHPELFAAIAPTCGNTDHSVWEEKWAGKKRSDSGQTSEKSMVPLRGLIQSALDPITYAANLKNVPVYCAHGARDTIVLVEHSRNMVRRLREVGGEVKYAEFPEADHGDFPDWLFKDQVAWLLKHRRARSPVPAKITVGDLLPWQKERKPGPVEDAFLSRFLVIYGTSSEDSIENLVARREAEQLVHEWKRRYGHPCRCKSDKEVTEEDTRDSNLILYGGPQQNAISRLFEKQAPLKISDHAISWGGAPREETVVPWRTRHHGYQGDDLGAKFCFPNPRNSERYIVVFAGTTWRGLFQINQRFGNWFDWGAYDNRNWFDYAVFDSRSVDPEGFLAVGFIRSSWLF